MDWAVFHFTTALVTVFFAHGWVKGGRRQHIIGAHILFWSSVASSLARQATGGTAPLELYAFIDVLAVTGFWLIMWRKRAAWAAVCVILHTAMLFLHLAYFVQGEAYRHSYLTMLGTLFFLCVLTINSAIITGRLGVGERLDRWFYAHILRSTWSGLLFPRDSASQRALARQKQ